MNFKIINNDATLEESRDIKKMLRIGDSMSFKENSYKVVSKELDVFKIKVGNPFPGKKTAMIYKHIDVFFNLDKKIIN